MAIKTTAWYKEEGLYKHGQILGKTQVSKVTQHIYHALCYLKESTISHWGWNSLFSRWCFTLLWMVYVFIEYWCFSLTLSLHSGGKHSRMVLFNVQKHDYCQNCFYAQMPTVYYVMAIFYQTSPSIKHTNHCTNLKNESFC